MSYDEKIFLLFFVVMLAFNVSAQTEHMKFAGVPLTGTIEQFQRKLMGKGFRLRKDLNRLIPVGTRCFSGMFAGKQGTIAVYYDSETKMVYSAKVYYDGLTESDAKDELENFKSMLSIKYGADNITDDKDEDGNATFTVNTGLGLIYCYTKKNENLAGYPYHWSAHAEFQDFANSVRHQSNVLDDF